MVSIMVLGDSCGQWESTIQESAGETGMSLEEIKEVLNLYFLLECLYFYG
jgi:hypothetical protein